MNLLPTGLGQARDNSLVSQLPQADPAKAELAEVAPRPPTAPAAVVSPAAVLGSAVSLDH